MLRIFEIIASKHFAGIFLNCDEETCDQQSTSYQKVLGFQNSLKKMFSNSICLPIMENYNERAAALISAVFVTHQHVDS